MVEGRVAAAAAWISLTASPSAVAGLQVERNRHRRQLAGVADRQRTGVGADLHDRAERDQRRRRRVGWDRRRPHVQFVQRRRILLELRRDLQDHLVLVVRRINLRHLPRAVGVIQSALNLSHVQAERRDLVAIQIDLDLRILQLKVAADVFDALDLADLGLEQRRPVIQLRRVGILHRELIEAARALLATEVDRWLVHHVNAHARHLRQLRPQLRHDLIDVEFPLGARLQVDGDAALVESAAAGATADIAAQSGNVRILPDDRGDLFLVAHHLVEADALDRLDADVESSLILGGQEAFRNQTEQIDRSEDQRD